MAVVSVKCLVTLVVALFALIGSTSAIEEECKACRAIAVSARDSIATVKQHGQPVLCLFSPSTMPSRPEGKGVGRCWLHVSEDSFGHDCIGRPLSRR